MFFDPSPEDFGPVVKRCGCGATYTERQYKELRSVGRLDEEEDGDQRLDLRVCRCGSSIAVSLPVG